MVKGSDPLRVLLHAPTQGALDRARSNALNLLRAQPSAEVRIVVNAAAVAYALDEPHPETDAYLLVCGNTLARLGRQAPAQIATVPASIITLAERQRDGWTYIRA